MATPVIMPKLEMAQETATVVEWLKREGEYVEKGEPLLVVETEKITVEIEAPASGILAGVRVGPGDVVPVTQIIAYILEPGEELPDEARTGVAPVSVPARPSVSPLPEIPPSPSVPPLRAPAATPVARRLAETYGIDLGTVVGTGPGGQITRSDVEAVRARSREPMVAPPSPEPEKVRATPAARRIAREQGVDLTTLRGTGPRGRIQAADVLQAIQMAPPAAAPEVIPLTGMRRTIAERMTASYQAVPHIMFTVSVDVGALEEMRARLNRMAEAEGGPHISLTALLVKAVAWTLRRHPWLNSTLRGEEIHLLPEINIGVAVALDTGLIVPVVHQADRKGLAEIAAAVNDRVRRAREGRLTPTDVAGGTFTISNLGPFGIEQFTAIINPPQVAILAVGAATRQPVADDTGGVRVRPIMKMTLSVDHRVVDGAQAALFLKDLKTALEFPYFLLC